MTWYSISIDDVMKWWWAFLLTTDYDTVLLVIAFYDMFNDGEEAATWLMIQSKQPDIDILFNYDTIIEKLILKWQVIVWQRSSTSSKQWSDGNDIYYDDDDIPLMICLNNMTWNDMTD